MHHFRFHTLFRPRNARTVLQLGVFALIAATAGSVVASSAPASAGGSVLASGAASLQVPALSWTDCNDGFQCATAKVPLDYDHPQGAKVSLALVRLPASDPAHRQGSLFLNPGGPGNSAVDAVRADARSLFGTDVLARFDVVGVDPRGVGASSPVHCFASVKDQQSATSDVPAFPVTPTERVAFRASSRALARSCGTHGGALLAHMSTANSARDLDLVRRAVGDARLTMVGQSYGSFLAQTYAALFPGHVRALVLDGVVDPVAWSTGHSRVQGRQVPFSGRLGSAEGTVDTMAFFLGQCAAAGPEACAFADGAGTTTKFETLLDRLAKKPVDLGGQALTYAGIVDALRGGLQFPPIWGDVAGLLQASFELSEPGTGAAREVQRSIAALAKARAVLTATEEAENYDATREALLATACVDSTNPQHARAWDFAAKGAEHVTPHWGPDWIYLSQPCAFWPVPDHDRYTGPYTKKLATPPLVLGARHDAATDYSLAVSVTAGIQGARLLTLEGAAHPASVTGNPCIRDAMSTYLLKGKLPDKGASCVEPAPFS